MVRPAVRSEERNASSLVGPLRVRVLTVSGMFTTYAQRVTRAEVNTGSQFDHLALYAPKWCTMSARLPLRQAPGLRR